MNAKHLTKNAISHKFVFLAVAIAIAIIAAFSICATTQAKAESNVINNGAITVFNENLDSGNNRYSPIYTFYADYEGSASQYIIPAEKLTSIIGKKIKGLKYYVSKFDEQLPSHTFKAYIAEVGESTPSTFLDDTSADVVFTGSVYFSPDMTIILDTPYTYKGGNLAIEFVCVETDGDYCSNYFYSEPIDNGTIYRNGWSSSTSSTSYAPKTTIFYSEASSDINVSGHVSEMGNVWQAVPGAFVQYCLWNPLFWDYVPVPGMSTFTDWFGNFTLEGIEEDMLPGVIRVYKFGYDVGESSPIWGAREGENTIYGFIQMTPEQPQPPVPPVPPTPPVPPVPPQPVPPTPVPPTPVDPGTNVVPQTGDAAGYAFAIFAMMSLLSAGVLAGRKLYVK